MCELEMFERLCPALGAGLTDGRPVTVLWFTGRRAREAAARLVFPAGHVQDELPDAVCIREGLRCRLLPGDAVEDRGQRRAVPRVTGMFAFELIDDSRDLVHRT